MYSACTSWPALPITDLSSICDVEQATIRSTFEGQKHMNVATSNRCTRRTYHLRCQIAYGDTNRGLTESDTLGARSAGWFRCLRGRTVRISQFRVRYAQRNRTRVDLLLEITLGFDDVDQKFRFLLDEHGEGSILDGECQVFGLRQGGDAVLDSGVHIRWGKESAFLTKTIQSDFTSVDFVLLLQFVHVTFRNVRQVPQLRERERSETGSTRILAVPDSWIAPWDIAWGRISP